MSIVKYLVVCASVLLVFSYIAAAAEVPKMEKRVDNAFQTYVIEPTNDFEQQDVTTIIPPLVEGEPSPYVQPAVDNFVPDASINLNPENAIKIPDGPIDQYSGGPYIAPPYYPQYQIQQQYPWPYYSQSYYSQQPVYTAQPNSQFYVPPQENTQTTAPQSNPQTYASPSNGKTPYIPVQADFEGVLVPIQTLMPPTPQPYAQTQQTNVNKDSRLDNKITPARSDSDLAILLQALLPPKVLQIFYTWINYILSSVSMMAVAAVITSAICSLTPICTLTFGAMPISFQRKFTATMGNGSGTTMQRVRRAADMVSNAIEKYEKLQKKMDSFGRSLK